MSQKYNNFFDENEGKFKFNEEIKPNLRHLFSKKSLKFNEFHQYDRYLMPPNLEISENHLVQ